MGKRLSLDLFVISDDIIQQLPQILVNYWYLPLFSFLLIIGFYFLDKNFFSVTDNKSSLYSSVVGMLFLGLSFIGIRGGLQHKSINIQSAFVQGKNELGHLVLNTPYHFLRTLKNEAKKKLTYFKTDDDAKAVILNRRDFRSGIKGKENANVVLIILESFASEYLENGHMPFLDELKERGVYFTRHLANGRRSIESLPSLLCGLPSLLNEPISKSIYSGNRFSCFPDVLKKNGYTNHFFHAGSRGTMGFESYTLSSGFHKYYSREDYGDKDFDGTWGIFDLPYFQYVAKEMNKLKAPFLVGLFSLSSHQPYRIPKEFQGKFPKGTIEIHESIGYTDFALRMLFQSIEKEQWFKDTYFIITADHTQKLESRKYSNLVGRYRVPLIILGPGLEKSVNLKVTHHSDIPKTVLDLLEIDGEIAATSVSAFVNDGGAALNFADGSTYFLASEDKVFTLETENQYDWETGVLTPIGQNKEPLLKAYLQYFQNGLITNNLSF
jgi:phosphoglycerol transferase MdoB-like AlkP superfamily enzyme